MIKTNTGANTRRENNLNHIKLTGRIAGDAAFSHSVARKTETGTTAVNFLRFTLEVPRLSGVPDFLNVIVPEDMWLCEFKNRPDSAEPGDNITAPVVEVSGRIQSYSHTDSEPGRNKLDVFVFAKTVKDLSASAEVEPGADGGNSPEAEPGAVDGVNTLILEGYLCKKPVVRETPLGRTIADLFIAVNRSYGNYYGASYIPVILWGANAMDALNLRIGDKLRFTGRFQSRAYWKNENGEMTAHTVHEVSASSVKLLDE